MPLRRSCRWLKLSALHHPTHRTAYVGGTAEEAPCAAAAAVVAAAAAVAAAAEVAAMLARR
jgi:hypothetical protein